MREELQGYVDVLMGRVDPPMRSGVSTLAEVANAYYSRGREIEMLLYKLVSEGHVLRSSPHAKFRTEELRSFIELTKQTYEMGSRRLTAAQQQLDT